MLVFAKNLFPGVHFLCYIIRRNYYESNRNKRIN